MLLQKWIQHNMCYARCIVSSKGHLVTCTQWGSSIFEVLLQLLEFHKIFYKFEFWIYVCILWICKCYISMRLHKYFGPVVQHHHLLWILYWSFVAFSAEWYNKFWFFPCNFIKSKQVNHFYWSKGQQISKAIYGVLNSPKKRALG